jgi:hypothetical protein
MTDTSHGKALISKLICLWLALHTTPVTFLLGRIDILPAVIHTQDPALPSTCMHTRHTHQQGEAS